MKLKTPVIKYNITYNDNSNENYDLLLGKTVVAEMFLNEDAVINLINDIKEFLYSHRLLGDVLTIKNDIYNVGILVLIFTNCGHYIKYSKHFLFSKYKNNY